MNLKEKKEIYSYLCNELNIEKNFHQNVYHIPFSYKEKNMAFFFISEEKGIFDFFIR